MDIPLLGCQRRQGTDQLGPRHLDRRTMAQKGVIEGPEMVGGATPVVQTAQQGIALFEHAPVADQLVRGGAVELGHEDVEEPAPRLRPRLHQLKVVGPEEDHRPAPDQVSRGDRVAVTRGGARDAR